MKTLLLMSNLFSSHRAKQQSYAVTVRNIAVATTTGTWLSTNKLFSATLSQHSIYLDLITEFAAEAITSINKKKRAKPTTKTVELLPILLLCWCCYYDSF